MGISAAVHPDTGADEDVGDGGGAGDDGGDNEREEHRPAGGGDGGRHQRHDARTDDLTHGGTHQVTKAQFLFQLFRRAALFCHTLFLLFLCGTQEPKALSKGGPAHWSRSGEGNHGLSATHENILGYFCHHYCCFCNYNAKQSICQRGGPIFDDFPKFAGVILYNSLKKEFYLMGRKSYLPPCISCFP